MARWYMKTPRRGVPGGGGGVPVACRDPQPDTPMTLRSTLRCWLAATCLAALSLAGAVAPQLAQAQVQVQGGAGGAAVVADGRVGPVRVEAVEVELVSENAALAPGQPARLGLRLRHDPHWHTYWRNPGDSGLPTQFEPSLPEGFRAGPIEWPAPARILIPPLANYGYEDEIVLPRRVEVPERIEAGSVRFDVVASWLVCRDVCIPGEAKLELTLPVARDGTSGPGPHLPLFERAAARSPGAAVPADYHVDEQGRLSILVPEGAGGPDAVVEFFPHVEGAVVAAAPQRLYR